MWASFLELLVQIADLVFPVILNWILSLLTGLKASTTAQNLFIAAKPTTVEEFTAVYSKMLDAAIHDMHPNFIDHMALEIAKNHLLRPKVVAITWNASLARGIMTGKAAPDVSFGELLAEAAKE